MLLFGALDCCCITKMVNVKMICHSTDRRLLLLLQFSLQSCRCLQSKALVRKLSQHVILDSFSNCQCNPSGENDVKNTFDFSKKWSILLIETLCCSIDVSLKYDNKSLLPVLSFQNPPGTVSLPLQNVKEWKVQKYLSNFTLWKNLSNIAKVDQTRS